MGNTHSQAAEKFVLRGGGEVSTQLFLPLRYFSPFFILVVVWFPSFSFLPPQDSGSPGGQYKHVGCSYSSHSSLSFFVCFIFLLFYRHQNENSAQDIACIKQPMLLSEPEHWAFTDGFHQTDPELWQPRRYS